MYLNHNYHTKYHCKIPVSLRYCYVRALYILVI